MRSHVNVAQAEKMKIMEKNEMNQIFRCCGACSFYEFVGRILMIAMLAQIYEEKKVLHPYPLYMLHTGDQQIRQHSCTPQISLNGNRMQHPAAEHMNGLEM